MGVSRTFLIACLSCFSMAWAAPGSWQMRDLGEPLTQADFDLALATDFNSEQDHDEDGSPDLFEGDIELTDEDRSILETRGMVGLREVVKTTRWLKSSDGLVRIPYKVPANMDQTRRAQIAKTVLEYKRKTCIRFVPYNNEERHYIDIRTNKDKCSSPLGRQYKLNAVNFGPRCSWGNLVHEFMHSLGFYHEHTRTDRDDYINVNWDNIPEDWKHNFYKCSDRRGGCNDLDTGYDYGSIMHYGRKLSGSNSDAITPLRRGVRIGQRQQLSPLDVAGIVEYYECAPGTNDPTAMGDNCAADKNAYCGDFKEEGWCDANASPEHKSFMRAMCTTSCCGL